MFAGAVVALALWTLLEMIGIGVGLVSSDAGDVGSLRDLATSAAIWTFVAPLVALFIGGFVAGRLGMTREIAWRVRSTGS